ncbi:copper resistance protein CopC [Nocardioides sp.]|uniref:copper resistance CopC/CopD family protein n=1 Tax=Nocardioides sp. TaxID=35761 RepID=UPI002733FB13|nr:copper resistance protein CopC [Nocardioides sp.]MDP3892633.1 copper resistance protein CopC [Nocardioides sp.]
MTGHRQGGVRRALWLVVPALLLALAVVGPAGPAAAHASLVGTDPAEGAVLAASPGTITLTFDEPVRVADESAMLVDATGGTLSSPVSGGGTEVLVDVPDDLADGSYLLSWRVVSADGHPIAGSLTFSVGAATEMARAAPEPDTSVGVAALGIVQGLAYVALLLAGGLVLAAALLLPGHTAAEPVRARIRRLAVRSALVAALAFLTVAPLSVAHQLGLGPTGLASAPAWSLDLLGAPLLVALLVTGGLVAALAVLRERTPGRLVSGVVLGSTAVAVAAPSLVGHARGTDPVALMLVGDVVHLGAGAIWLGGLVAIAVALRGLSQRPALAAGTLARFSTWAGGAVVLLTVTGSFMAWRIIGSWSALFSTTYGRLLLLKIALALLVVGIAAWNRFVLLPRVASAAGPTGAVSSARGVGRTAATEAAVLAVLLLVTGFLVNQSPRAATDTPTVDTGAVVATLAEDVRVAGLLSPGTTGPNTLLVQIQSADGDPLEPYAAPQVTLRSDAVDLGQVPLVSARAEAGSYRAEIVLPPGGPWELQVSLRQSEFENPVTTLQLTD